MTREEAGAKLVEFKAGLAEGIDVSVLDEVIAYLAADEAEEEAE